MHGQGTGNSHKRCREVPVLAQAGIAGLAINRTAPPQQQWRQRRQSNQCRRKELIPCTQPTEYRGTPAALALLTGPTPTPSCCRTTCILSKHVWVCCGPLLNAAQSPPPTLSCFLHSMHPFPTHAWVCCGPPLNAAQSPHPATHGLQLHSQPIIRASYTHRATYNTMQHVTLSVSLSWRPLAQRERVHSCQPLTTSHTRA